MSTTFKVAHFKEQGKSIIAVLVGSQFGRQSASEQHAVCDELQARANAAGLGGTVVPVWNNGGGRMGFLAPRPWHPFFRSIGLREIAANISHNLTCS